MSIKSGAQPPMDTAVTSLDFIQSVITLSKNPDLISKMKADLIQASTISEEKKKEAAEAAKTISDAQEASKRLEKEKLDHEAKVASYAKTLADKASAIIADSEALLKKKQEQSISHAAKIAEAEDFLKAADDKLKQANDRHIAADKRESDLAAKQDVLKASEDDLTRRQAIYADNLLKFAKRKKKLEDATKDD